MVKEALTHEHTDIFRRKILETCTTPKTSAQIERILGETSGKVYSQAHALVKLGHLIKTVTSSATNPRIVKFETINPNYHRAAYPKQRQSKEPPPLGHFIHKIENFAEQHIATSKKTREDYKSSKTSIGISTVYHE